MAKKKKQEEAPAGSPAWMATFSDLMNLLLCFFVLLFSMSSIEVSKFEELASSLNSSFTSSLSIFEHTQKDSVIESEMFPKNVEQIDDAKMYQADTSKEDSKNQEELDTGEIVKKEQEKAARELYENVSEYIEKAQLDEKVELTMDKQFQYVKLTISGALVFSSGEAVIKKEAKIVLNRIGNILKNYQDNLIKIEGHSDNVPLGKSKGKYNDNMELSYARAYEVWKYMTKEKNMPPQKLEASGRSQYNPIADNTTAKGRMRNRRVEFKIYTDLNS